MEGGKEDGDAALRPAVDMPQKNGLTEYLSLIHISGRLPPGAGRARRALRRYRADAGCNAALGGKDAFLLFAKMSYRPGAIWEGVSDGHRLFAGAVFCPAAGEG